MKTPFTDYTFPDATGNTSFETVLQSEGSLLNPDQIDEAVQHEIIAVSFSKPAIDSSVFLSVQKNNKSLASNKGILQKSGLPFQEIMAAIDKCIDTASIRQAMLTYNQKSSADKYVVVDPAGTTPDAVFIEAIHQFQLANYIDPAEHDGVAGTSTLDTLGFVKHGLRQTLNSSGFYGQSQLNRSDVKPSIPSATNHEFSSSNWYNFILKPSWLGVKISNGVHLLLLRKLREAEGWLLNQPQYKNMTPAALGKALGFNSGTRYSAARLSAGKQAMHGFGLAIDINVAGNPWIGAGWIQHDKVLLQERYRMIDALRKASGDKSLPGKTIFQYLDNIAQTAGVDTLRAYKILKQRNDEFVVLLKNNPADLTYWKKSQTFGNRNPLDGFLNLHPDLVYALRQIAGLAWGAIDFGPNASGDIMHFDMRTIGVGKFLCEKINGFVPKRGHPSTSAIPVSKESGTEELYEHLLMDEMETHEAIEELLWENTDSELVPGEQEPEEINYEEMFFNDPELKDSPNYQHFSCPATLTPSVEHVFDFNRWYGQKILDTINTGIISVNTHLKFNPKTQLEKIVRGEQVIHVNPLSGIVEVLPVIHHICEQARMNNYGDIVIGSFIREPKSDGSCTGHCAGRCIDINFKGGSFESAGSVKMVIYILNYLTGLPTQYKKNFGFGLPLQGDFFGHKGLVKFKRADIKELVDPQLRQLIPQLGIVFPDNDNHLHIQVRWY